MAMNSFFKKLAKAAAEAEDAPMRGKTEKTRARAKPKRKYSRRSKTANASTAKTGIRSSSAKKPKRPTGKDEGKAKSIEGKLESNIGKTLDDIEMLLSNIKAGEDTALNLSRDSIKMQEEMTGMLDDMGKQMVEKLDPPVADAFAEFSKRLRIQQEEQLKIFSDRIRAVEFMLSDISARIAALQNETKSGFELVKKRATDKYNQLGALGGLAAKRMNTPKPKASEYNARDTRIAPTPVFAERGELSGRSDIGIKEIEHKIKKLARSDRHNISNWQLMERLNSAEYFLVKAGMQGSLPVDYEIKMLQKIAKLREAVRKRI